MFEAHVLHLLRRYLGEYVHGLSAEALRISVWKGDVVLKDLKLKAEALNSLRLPVIVKAGFVGCITLKVPWKSLGKEPVIVLIDRVFVLAHPASDFRTLKEEDREKLLEAKLQQIEEAEAATIEALSKSKIGSPPGNSWLGSLIATIIGNLKISISNVHVRYEDSISHPGYPFASGVTLAKLAAVTMDEHGNETFDASGALDKLRKSLQLERLAMYHDCDSPPWKIDKRWEDLSPKEWIEIFEDGINEPAGQNMVSKWAVNRSYLVSPINGVLKYHRLGKQERNDPEIPFEKASLAINDVSLMVTEAQYYDWIKLMEVVSRYKTYVEVSHLRPVQSVSEDPRLWWRYAAQASLQQKKICYRFSWDRIKHLCQLRRHYVQLYAGLLQQPSSEGNSALRVIERDLDPKVILLWRLLAHAKAESVRSKEAAERRRLRKGSWFSFRWRTSSEENFESDAAEKPSTSEGRLTKEEWQAINNLLSHQLDEELTLPSGKDMQNMVRFLVTVSIRQAAARIVSIENIEIVCGRFEQLQVSTKLKHQSTCCDVSLRFYGLSASEGSLAESVSSERKMNALAASFVSSPVGENVDWKLSATISPCHVTVWMESYNRLLEFIKRSNAVSPTVAFETATALQNKFEMVTRRAQEQFQMVLEEQSRFALDIDLDAPKVRIPIRTPDFSKCDSHLLLDFGHFTLRTTDMQFEEQRQTVYSRFYIYGRDISAFFAECGSDCHSCALVKPTSSSQRIAPPLLVEDDRVCSLLDRCGMAVVVDKIKIPHPSYPSTRISIQVPNLGVHFSPSRYHRLIELSNILYGTMEIPGQPSHDFQPESAPWSHADLASDARILVWKGIGNSVATWQRCFLVLSGFYLYVLESEKSQSYQRCLSMAGRQIHEIPPTSIGGSPFCVAVSLRGVDTQKALESSNTWVVEFRDEEVKAAWLKGLLQATYQASAPPSVDLLGETSDSAAEQDVPQVSSSRTADIVIHGNLVEAKLFIYGKSGENDDTNQEEVLILEVLAGGGKVHIILLEGDLTVKAKLHSLKIKDALQGRSSVSQQYLAYSVLKKEHSAASLSDSHDMELLTPRVEDDDVFKDALPDFTSILESSMPNLELDVLMAGRIMEAADALLCDREIGKEKGFSGDIFYETQGNDNLDFVSVTFSTRSSESLDYDGIDTQMTITMSKLEFFCNRPTVVALIGFGFDVSSVWTAVNAPDHVERSDDVTLYAKEKFDDSWRIKGLLGYGKGRVVFNLYMKVDSVCLFLNKEDGSQLAMLEQKSFLLDIKVYPSSLSIEGTLGNFRLRDMSLGPASCWSWLCDIRNPGIDSLIKFKFYSYSAEDDDYKGYDYSLHGKLSAVRIVFLYRFVQEVMAYFMCLANPHSDEAIKLVDKVGGFEWLINKYEIDGSTALKLDLLLDTPIIIVPRNSMSKDFIQLDLGQLQVTNEFKWCGCPDEDPSAVRIDALHAEILGINMSVGIDGRVGKPMIREGQGLNVYVHRSLRDVFRKVPNFSLEVKVGLLHAAMSDKEYGVILDCLYLNLCEEPRLPPNFRGSSSASKDPMKLLADKVNMNSQMLLSRTVTIIAVEIDYALVELCNGIDEESPLAHILLEGLWVSYRMTSLYERDLYITIPRFSILDIRPETKSEMSLMLGLSTDSSKVPSSGDFPYSTKKNKSSSYGAGVQSDVPKLTMFLMDYRLRTSSQSVVIRIQQPRVLVVPDFLLAVGEFFVPALGAITGREETMDPKNDPITKSNSIILTEAVHKQSEDVVQLSPSRQLVADAPGVDEYIYDGCGKTICLNEKPDSKDFQSVRSEPIIIIGRGKKLRFTNVKIENGSLLRKRTYLSNDSCYSVSFEDGVNISQLDNFTSDSNPRFQDSKNQSIDTSSALLLSQDDPKFMQSFTFEGQVIAPEFTFYDGTKSFLDDSSQGERLLRAKMDLSFMYAAKDNDTWIRATVKDLMLEAGSGLVIIDPVDISGGYTSVREKTNISVLSTDICIRLSLSAISLVNNLLSQAAAALQFGNAVPLAPCTNFDRLWVSPKDNGSGNHLTFWRPQAPPNYVVLGDCITSRPSAPSQTVMAVSNSYGRVRKPISFALIGMFSAVLEYGSDQGELDNDCSIWMPVPPAGYTALGCVAHLGSEPPPNHVVYCVRSDLVTSTVCSECMYTAPASSTFSSGFSIWRLDNVVASFFAQASTEYPPRKCGLDLSHILLRNSMQHLVSSQESTNASMNDHENQSQQAIDQSTSSSGWDALRSISRATTFYISTPHFERIWWDKGNDVRRPVSIWRPIAHPSYAVSGDCITEGLEPPALGIIFRSDNPQYTARPVQFTKVAQIVVKGVDEIFFWYPIAPPGYVALGCVASRVDQAPSVDLFCCPRMDLVSQANILEMPISKSSSSKASQCWSIWKVENQACTFLARPDMKKPSSRLAYTICDSVKPKTRENITAEMRLKCLSLTVLDSLYGMVTPLFDTTITNIKLATHGRLEAMNAVLVSSIAASTFNTHLEAWEPLVEPFDGIFKFETYATDGNTSSKLGKRIRVAATNMLNINISAANLETFVESTVSWRRILELEQKAAKLNEEAGRDRRSGQRPTLSALDEDDLQRIVVENKLGCDFYLKRVEENMDIVDLLHDGDCTSVWIPPPRFSDRLNVADESREARHYVCIHILEAKGLAIADDGNSHNFFCALRLVVNNQTTDQQKIYPQSARTRCVKPSISNNEGTAKWNEFFIFEVPRKGLAKLEVEVTNLAAKAGKGEVVGALSFSVGHGVHKLKKVASARMFYHPTDAQNVATFPLKGKHQPDDAENIHDCGILLASTSYYERNTGGEIKEDAKEENAYTDVGFWIGVSDKGTWESIRSSLPLSVAPKLLENDYIAMEIFLKEGKKHAIFRSLVTVVNDVDVKLELSVCSVTSVQSNSSSSSATRKIVVEEVFQNQRYHPMSGWGNSSLRDSDPGHWSTGDLSYSSKNFFEPSLSTGWRWASPWAIEKSRHVDADGWAYGSDFQSLRWPLSSMRSSVKSANDAVRRRRWIRSRQQLPEQALDFQDGGLTTINPGSSCVLSWKSTLRNSNQCLRIRPCVDQNQSPYAWGQAVALDSVITGEKEQPFSDQGSRQRAVTQGDYLNFIFRLNQLEKKDMLLVCSHNIGRKQFWLSVGTDASVLHTDRNAPVYDWKISVNSSLKLENRLPCSAEFTIWERTKQGNFVECQRGVINSRKVVNIYNADVQKPLYLSLYVQGGWSLEKEPVLLSDLSSNQRISSLWMVQQQSRRRIRFSMEHDMGGSNVAPRTIRFFVPYWIANDTNLHLAYHLVEIEYMENVDADTVLLSRAVKSAKTALRSPSLSMSRRNNNSKKTVQVLEVIEDSSPMPSMLSPLDYASRSGALFQSQKDSFLSPRIGISVAVHGCDIYSPGISLLELEKKEWVDVKAHDANGSYYKLSAQLTMSSDRTKVIHFLPHTLFVNRVGCDICLKQCDSQLEEWIHSTDPPKQLGWQSSSSVELLKVRVDGFGWSMPFSISSEGRMRLSLPKESGSDHMHLRVQVRSGIKQSRYEVVLRPDFFSSPYRIENRSMFLPIRFRQVDGTSNSWQFLLPNAAASFLWEDLGRRRFLELMVDGSDEHKSEKYCIDEAFDYRPIHTGEGVLRALQIAVLKEERINVVRITDWMPEYEYSTIRVGLPPPLQDFSKSDSHPVSTSSGSEFHVVVEFAELGISIVDHTPEEILYLSIQNLLLAYSTGLASGFSRFKLRMDGLQIDNQLPLTPMPVLFRPQKVREEGDHILKFSVTMQSNGSLDLCVYPYIGLQGPENSAFAISIHEPIIWRLHEMIQQVNLSRLYETHTTAVSVDPIIQIGVLNLSEVRFKVSMAMSPSQRPRGVLGFWSSLMTALGNTENMPVKINQRFHENISMRQTSMISNCILNIRKDLLSQPLQLLSGVDILGNASSALGHMSKGVAALSMDKKFIQSRQRQENKGVEDLSDVIREGGGALAKGLFRGVTGILTKPYEGAKTSGVEGFVQGVGKGLIGAAAQPVSGVLDLLSKTTEGANAMRMKIISAITSEEQLLRRRLPRVIGGDNLLRPYDEYKAEGQVMLQLAECGSFLGQVDLFKVRGKFALSDAYEDHFSLPKAKTLVVTHRRVILLQQTSNIIAQRKFNPARDPCSVLWEVLWDDLMTMELTHGKKDHPKAPYSRLVLYLKSKPPDYKELVRVIKCIHDTLQAFEIYSSIERAMNTYGPNKLKDSLKNVVPKPYSPRVDNTDADIISKDTAFMWSSQHVPPLVPHSSTFGSNST